MEEEASPQRRALPIETLKWRTWKTAALTWKAVALKRKEKCQELEERNHGLELIVAQQQLTIENLKESLSPTTD